MRLPSSFILLPRLVLFRARPDFGTEPHGRKLTLTFNVLTSILAMIAALTMLWAVAAGLLHAGFLATRIDAVFPGTATAWTAQAAWLAPPLGALIYVFEAVATTLLVFLAAACIGAIVGFLFGVPRPISESGSEIAAAAQTATQGTDGNAAQPRPLSARQADRAPQAAPTRAATNWRASTNLTQVSDWLTKIIVGVGLVEARPIYDAFARMSGTVSGSIFAGMHGAAIVVPCLILAGLIMGFLYAYLFTQLFLAAMMVFSAEEVGYSSPLDGKEAAVAQMQSLSPASATLAGGMGPGSPPRDPTAAETDAARTIAGVALDELRSATDIQTWSRGMAVARDYAAAARGYRRLLGIVSTPEVLAEAARVLAQAGAGQEASELLRRAVLDRDRVSPELRLRITSDAANLALYEPPPKGYVYALSLLNDQVMAEDRDSKSGQLFVLRACANGQRLRALSAELTPDAKATLTDTVLKDVTDALTINPTLRPWIRRLWDPQAARAGGADRDDDLEIFFDDPRFKELLAAS